MLYAVYFGSSKNPLLLDMALLPSHIYFSAIASIEGWVAFLCCRVAPQDQRMKQQATPATDAKRNATATASAPNGLTPRAGPSYFQSTAHSVHLYPRYYHRGSRHAASVHVCNMSLSNMACSGVPARSVVARKLLAEGVGIVAGNAAAADQSREAGAGAAGPPASKKLQDAREWCSQHLSPTPTGIFSSSNPGMIEL